MLFCHTEMCITSTCFLLHCCLFFYKPIILSSIRFTPPLTKNGRVLEKRLVSSSVHIYFFQNCIKAVGVFATTQAVDRVHVQIMGFHFINGIHVDPGEPYSMCTTY